MRRLLAAALCAVAACVPVPVHAAPQTSLADLEDEVMCPICGTLLELSSSPQAERERVFIAGLVREGRSKAQIKDALVAEYGREVLAEPSDSGFDLWAYVLPVLGFALAAAALVVGIARWRRPPPPREEGEARAAPSGEEAERLDADIARYDL
jgi:cytochrome c-type biogenesis protein CcmH/NrfF